MAPYAELTSQYTSPEHNGLPKLIGGALTHKVLLAYPQFSFEDLPFRHLRDLVRARSKHWPLLSNGPNLAMGFAPLGYATVLRRGHLLVLAPLKAHSLRLRARAFKLLRCSGQAQCSGSAWHMRLHVRTKEIPAREILCAQTAVGPSIVP